MDITEEQRRWLEEYYTWTYGQGSKASQGKSGKFPHPPPSWFQPPSASENQSLSGLSLPPPQPEQYWSGSSVSRVTFTTNPVPLYSGYDPAVEEPPDPEPIKKTGPIVGFRAWEIENDTKGPRLASTGIENWWPEGKDLRADCRQRPHSGVPGYHCACGFYARRSLGRVNHGYGFNARFAFGAALLWGRLVAHYDKQNWPQDTPAEKMLTGWRAEWARPLALLDTAVFQDNPDLSKLSERYQIPVLDRRSLLLYCAEYGEIV